VKDGELHVLLGGLQVGRVLRNKGRLRFIYDSAWRDRADAFPLSLSMPRVLSEHGHAVTDAFMWGLLPDNEQVQERWARRFQVSAQNAFALLAHVGEDCAGAVQFVRSDRLDQVLGTGPNQVDWLSIEDVAERLRILRGDQGAARLARDTGQFSLAGAQPKTALLFDGKRGDPGGTDADHAHSEAAHARPRWALGKRAPVSHPCQGDRTARGQL
jgi:serine/threonine-protein kinase HipA